MSSRRAGGRVVRRDCGRVHLPIAIDPNSMKAEYHEGMLHLSATAATSAQPGNAHAA